MWSHKGYNDRLTSCRLDHRQFDDMHHQSLYEKIVIDKLTVDFEILFEFKAICTKFLEFSYAENMELSIITKNMINLDLPTTFQWKLDDNYGKSKYRFHQ